MPALFLHCRPGFEGECAAEIQERAAALGFAGYCRARPDTAFAIFEYYAEDQRLIDRLRLDDLIFTRQWFEVLAAHDDLPAHDRITPIITALAGSPAAGGTLLLETPDTNEAKELQRLCRKLQPPLESALKKRGLLTRTGELQLHVAFLGSTHAVAGYAPAGNASPRPMGIPRLRFPREAPSRSTLKLEEALLHFLSEAERDRLLAPGMTAVDLGAAPGGWTWQLVRRHLKVIAVDNGPMDATLMDSGLVEHRREDGFRFRPERPVDWVVCDMVEKPARVAALMADWLAGGMARQALFNLKLPMKKRYPELKACLARVEGGLATLGPGYRLACRQLYHDREEVTVFARPGPGA